MVTAALKDIVLMWRRCVCPTAMEDYVRCLLCRSTGTIADESASCLEPHLGIEPSSRGLEHRCLFQLAYEAYSIVARPLQTSRAPISRSP